MKFISNKLTKALGVLTFAGTVFLTGCATGYHANSFNGGYSEQQVAANTMRVTFQGNGFSDNSKVYLLALRRAAELTLSHGYPYFDVTSKKNLSVHKTTYVSGVGGAAMPISSDMPKTELIIKFSKTKGSRSYTAKKVLAQTAKG